MSQSAYPTSVDLKSLPQDGEEYQFSRQTGELNKALQDLVPENPYSVEMTLRPIGNAFEISGQIQTQLDLICSRCGRDLKYPLHDRFQELIVVNPERPRAGHSGHTGGTLSSDLYCNELTTHHFDLAEFIHEHIAAAEPYAPYCERSDCEEHLQSAQGQWNPADEATDNPFQALRNLRLPPHQN